jgi:phosphoenolpyruvate-protein kinase (PTS system EI component)
MALVKENPELQYACSVLMEANSTEEVRALYEVDLKRWRDEQDRTEYAVNEAVKKAAAEKEAALKNAEAEKDAALEQTFQLLEQGRSIDEVKTIILKKASASKS